jgi:elongation factor P
MAIANDLRKGSVIDYQGHPHSVMEVVHRSNGRGRGFIQATMRNLHNGSSTVVKFMSTETINFCDTENAELEFSYEAEDGFHFMDPKSFEDVVISKEVIGDNKYYLVSGIVYDVRLINGKPVQISLPGSVELNVVEAPEVIRGDTATNVLKVATTDTGLEVKVPAFVKVGDRIKVSTLEGSYISRV